MLPALPVYAFTGRHEGWKESHSMLSFCSKYSEEGLLNDLCKTDLGTSWLNADKLEVQTCLTSAEFHLLLLFLNPMTKDITYELCKTAWPVHNVTEH